MPYASPPLYANPSSSHYQRGYFATKHLFATPFSEHEKYPAGIYPLEPNSQGIRQWTASVPTSAHLPSLSSAIFHATSACLCCCLCLQRPCLHQWRSVVPAGNQCCAEACTLLADAFQMSDDYKKGVNAMTDRLIWSLPCRIGHLTEQTWCCGILWVSHTFRSARTGHACRWSTPPSSSSPPTSLMSTLASRCLRTLLQLVLSCLQVTGVIGLERHYLMYCIAALAT